MNFCFKRVAVVGGLKSCVDKSTKIVQSFLCCFMMMCGACNECGYSVWNQAKTQNESGVVRWQRKSYWRVISVFC